MDFSITEDQQSLQKLVGEVLADNATHEHLKELEAACWSVFDRTLWRQLAQAGVTGIAVPETAGGAGLGFLEVGLVLEQIGRAVAPVPAAASLVTGYVFVVVLTGPMVTVADPTVAQVESYRITWLGLLLRTGSR